MSMENDSNNPMRSLRPCDDKLMSGRMCQQLEVRLYGDVIQELSLWGPKVVHWLSLSLMV